MPHAKDSTIWRHAALLLLLLLLGGAQGLFASHLVGGNLTYTFLGKSGSNYRYEIKVEMYRDYQNSTTAFDNSIDVGVYYNEPFNKRLYQNQVLTMGPPDEDPVPPKAVGANCINKPKSYVNKGVYKAEITLPYSSYGYHISYIRCCRNNLVNVAQFEGQTYYAFIPPHTITNTTNSSPYFKDDPVPYIGTNDTASIPNIAYDDDGDSMVYSLAWPYAGGDQNDPAPTPSSSFVTPPLVNYLTGYSVSKPFGNSGYASIDPVTGLTRIYTTKTGYYAIAIDITEYRKGKLLSKVRRDIQVIVIPGNPSPTPRRVDVISGGGTTPNNKFSYTITGGDSFSFPVYYQGGDTLHLRGSGDILGSSFPNPATFPNADAAGIVASRFSWQTTCANVRTQAYIFTAFVYNDNCPPKFVYNTYTVYVVPFKGADKIFGNGVACQGALEAYFMKGKPGNTFKWVVTGGVIEGDGDRDTLKVRWDKNATKGRIVGYEINPGKCVGDSVFYDISLSPPPPANELTGPINVCPGETLEYVLKNLGKLTNAKWGFTGGTWLSPASAYKASVVWDGLTDTGILWVVQSNHLGCKGDTIKLMVFKSIPKAKTLVGSASVCPNARGIDYYITDAVRSSIYTWNITGGLPRSSGTGQVQVDWGNKGMGRVSFIETTKYGCKGDSVWMDVLKDYNLITPPITGDTSLCEFGKGFPYLTPFTRGSYYDWKVTGGDLFGQGNNRILVDWGPAGAGRLQVLETAWDSVNNQGCIGKPIYLDVTLNPVPDSTSIAGPLFICQNKEVSYTATGLPGSTFTWRWSGVSAIDSPNRAAIRITPREHGDYTLTVQELSKDSCLGQPVSIKVRVYPAPITSEIQGADKVCAPGFMGQPYGVTGFAGSTFEWDVIGGDKASGDSSPAITVDWTRPGTHLLRVLEKSPDGCPGIEKTLTVRVDSLYLKTLLISTLPEDDRRMEIRWQVKNDSFFPGPYRLWRGLSPGDAKEFVDTANRNARAYVDSKVKTDAGPWTYIIEGRNICGASVLSDPHTSVFLSVEKAEDTLLNLFWTRYRGWTEGVREYRTGLALDEQPIVHFLRTTQDTAEIETIPWDGWRQCYRAIAVQDGADTLKSYSNAVCFDFEPEVYIPNAFTPDGNFLNDKFRVTATHYKSFKLTVYNRWGERIFTSDSHLKMWDGTFRGAPSPNDVYLIMVEVEGQKTTVRKNITMHLLR